MAQYGDDAMSHIMPSPFRERLMAAKKDRANIDSIIADAKATHPWLFVSAEEERKRNWIPPSILRKEGKNHVS